MTTQPDATAIDPTKLPGRIVDIAYTAARRVGIEIHSISVQLTAREVVCHTGDASDRAVRAMLSGLGAEVLRQTNASSDGLRQELSAPIPTLGWTVRVWALVDEPLPLIESAALIAEVDAARASAAEQDGDR